MFKGIDLFSDTATRPSATMKKAMMDAELGDEQLDEDPTTQKLEIISAELLGHECAMFFPSATMANQIALKLLCEPGEEIIAAEQSHIFFAEAGGPAIHAGAMSRPIKNNTGVFTGDDVRATYRFSKGAHYPVTKLVSVENTTNMYGGIAWDLASLNSVLDTAKDLNLKAHLDGARLFNAAVKKSATPREIASRFDTVTICLSKGLGCPIGAILAFAKNHYEKVRRFKQLMGGAMRQSGILAAAGIYALQNNIERLVDDHNNATKLAERLNNEIPQVRVENPQPSTNMVFFDWIGKNMSSLQFRESCINKGLRFSHVGENRFRAVTHLDVNNDDIDTVIEIIKEISAK